MVNTKLIANIFNKLCFDFVRLVCLYCLCQQLTKPNNMSITSIIASRIWKQKARLGTLSAVHTDFIRWGGKCSYETFRQFSNESTLGSGELLNQLDRYLTEKEFE